nr:retrovirus-related Pol polyprotein from transposon TNT 1-94 [Tanacetum cinerariifolium]
VDLEPDEWIKDSGCSKHMTSNQKLFSSYKAYNGGNVIFGSNLRGNFIGKDEEEAIRETEKKNLENVVEDETLEIDEIVNIKESRNHPLENVIGNLNQRTLRLVAQGYNQQEGIDYDETYALVARLKSIGILLAYACALDFKLFQMDVKSAFLNSLINEETRSYHGKKRPRELNTSSSSSTTQNHPSSSLPLDAIVDENNDESFHSNSSSPFKNISSSSNVVPRVCQNLPYESHDLNIYLSETINIQTQQRDAHRNGLRLIR